MFAYFPFIKVFPLQHLAVHQNYLFSGYLTTLETSTSEKLFFLIHKKESLKKPHRQSLVLKCLFCVKNVHYESHKQKNLLVFDLW